MADFKDRLWRDLVREHGDDLARMERTSHRRPRRRVVALGAAGLAAAGTALLVALGTLSTSPAFAVQRHADGRVTVVIYRSEGIRGANARLESLGIRVRAVPFAAGCAKVHDLSAATAPPALQRALKFARARAGALMSVSIDPRRLHPGKVMVLAARPGEVKPGTIVAEARDGQVPACVGTGQAPPTTAPGSVVCHTVDGKDVPLPPKQVPPGTEFNSGASGASGDSGTSGAPSAPRRGIVCQAHIARPGPSGSSGDSGASGVSGNS